MPDFVYGLYSQLMKGGWLMSEIDRMDMIGFLKIRIWEARMGRKNALPKAGYIDEVWRMEANV